MSLSDLFRQVGLLVGLPAVVLAGVGAVAIVVPRDWRAALFGYMLVSVMLALLLSRVLPSEWALLQVIVGGLIAVMLYLSASQLRGVVPQWLDSQARWPQMASLTSFRAMTVALGAVAFVALRGRISLPVVNSLLQDAIIWLCLVGVIGLSLHEEPLHAGLSLLTVLGGLELLLFALQQNRVLLGLILATQLLLGLAVAYLILSRGLPDRRSWAEQGSPRPSATPVGPFAEPGARRQDS